MQHWIPLTHRAACKSSLLTFPLDLGPSKVWTPVTSDVCVCAGQRPTNQPFMCHSTVFPWRDAYQVRG